MTDKSSPREEAGFALQFDKTSLWDLVQFQCLRGTQRILRVLSQGQMGFIYFRAGQMVHATTVRAAGPAAVREMLTWKDGSVEPWTGPWPEKESITASWQSLLLGAAESTIEPVSATASAPPPLAPRLEPPVEKVTLAPNGKILRGSASSGLPEAAAYAAQMADLIGEFLGLERFQTLEASFERTHYRLSRTPDGVVLAQRGSDPARFETAAPGMEASS